jgi:hypothetical protein
MRGRRSQIMNDTEWFHCNPTRLVRRRRIPGDPEMWILSLHDTSETLLVHGRLAAMADSEEALHVVATELLLEGTVDAERVLHAVQLAMEARPASAVGEAAIGGVGGRGGSGVVWPDVPGRERRTRELDAVGEA